MKPRTAVLSVTLALGLLAAPSPSSGQQPAKVYRIGYLAVSAVGYETNPQHCPIKGHPNWQAWVAGLREHGYIQGQNLVIECRYTEGREERAPALAAELVSLKPDLLVAKGHRLGLGAHEGRGRHRFSDPGLGLGSEKARCDYGPPVLAEFRYRRTRDKPLQRLIF